MISPLVDNPLKSTTYCYRRIPPFCCALNHNPSTIPSNHHHPSNHPPHKRTHCAAGPLAPAEHVGVVLAHGLCPWARRCGPLNSPITTTCKSCTILSIAPRANRARSCRLHHVQIVHDLVDCTMPCTTPLPTTTTHHTTQPAPLI